MFSLTIALRDGLILSVPASIVLIALLRANPRWMLQDYPPQIQALAPPRTAQEKRRGLILGLPFLILLIAVPLWSTLSLQQRAGGQAAFADLCLNAFVVLLVFNLVDLLVLDWGMFCTLTPRFLVIPGTGDAPGYKDYMFHLRGAMIGTVFSALGAMSLAGLVAVAG